MVTLSSSASPQTIFKHIYCGLNGKACLACPVEQIKLGSLEHLKVFYRCVFQLKERKQCILAPVVKAMFLRVKITINVILNVTFCYNLHRSDTMLKYGFVHVPSEIGISGTLFVHNRAVWCPYSSVGFLRHNDIQCCGICRHPTLIRGH